jgi:hypothetical protein
MTDIAMNSSGRTNKNISSSGIGPLQIALLARSKNKLRTNESELTELRKLVDAGKGGVPVSQLLSKLGCQTDKISCLGGTDNNVLENLEAAILKKEDECRKAREVIAEANKNQQGNTTRNPTFVSSVLPTQSSKRRSSLSSKSEKESQTQAPLDESSRSTRRRSSLSSRSEKKSEAQAPTDESSRFTRRRSSLSSSRSEKKSEVRAPTDEPLHPSRRRSSLSSRSEKKSEAQAPTDEPPRSTRRRSSLSSSRCEKKSETPGPTDESSRSTRRRSSLSSRSEKKSETQAPIDEPSRSTRRRSSLSSRSEKKSETARAPEMKAEDSEDGRHVPKYSINSDGVLVDESSHSSRSKSSLSSRSEKKLETRASEIRSGGSKEGRHVRKSSISSELFESWHSSISEKISETREIKSGGSKTGRNVRKSSITSDGFLIDESTHSSRSEKKSETRASEIRSGNSKTGRHARKSSITSDVLHRDESSHSSRSKNKSEARATEIRSGGVLEGRHARKSSKTTSDFLMDDCHQARKLIAEAGRNQQGSTPPRDPVCVSSVPPTQSSDLFRSEKKSEPRAPESRGGCPPAGRHVRKSSRTSIGLVIEF